MAIKSGQIALFRFPQTDLEPGKLRPALLIARIPGPYADWLICMISSQLQKKVDRIDEAIDKSDRDFVASGLKTPSLIRCSRLAVVSENIFLGPVGEISRERLIRIRTNIAAWISEAE